MRSCALAKKVLDENVSCPSIQRMLHGSRACFRFGQFEVDSRARVLRREGVKIRLQEQPFQVLLALLEAAGGIVTREELRQRLWPEGTFVEFDHALTTAVKKIRAALCDDAAVPRYVETIPRRGYRFLAPVDTRDSANSQTTPPSGVLARFRLPSLLPWAVTTIISGLVILLLIYTLGGLFRLHSAHAITLAVLPLSDMNINSGGRSLGAELSQALAERLRRTHPAYVIVSAVANEGRKKIGRMPYDQGEVDYVLQGGVFLDEQDAHVTIQLVRIRDQNSVWAENFVRRAEDAAWQGELAADIVGRLQPTLALLAGGSR